MTNFTKEDVLKSVKENNIKSIHLWFVDIMGLLKYFVISPNELNGAFLEGMGFDGSSINGFCRIDSSDLVAKPDSSTFTLVPSHSNQYFGRMFCDIFNPDGTPFAGDSRYILKKNLEKASKLGYKCYVGPELEYFYFKNSQGTEVLDEGEYFDLPPLDMGSDLREDTILNLERMGIPVEYSHHEVAPSQHEIDLRYQEALPMADAAVTYRQTVKEIAMKHGVYATFMPKPIFGMNGSGMHVHQSLFIGNKNAFFEATDNYGLSDVGKSYIAGLLKHAPEMSAIVCQWVNSYKRLVPGYEAPAYIAWARRNRSCLVRVPMYKPGKEVATRCELRCPDPACNPYLAFAIMLSAGLKGIEEKYVLQEPIEEDIFAMSSEKLNNLNIKSMPGTLGEAVEIFSQSSLAKECVGDHIFHNFIDLKQKEWKEYCRHVTNWEQNRCLPIL